MFVLKLYDRKGKELKLGDIVKVSLRGQFQFYAEVKYLPEENVVTPFHTFSFHSFEKVDKAPARAIKSTETRYNIWYVNDSDVDDHAEKFEHYLMEWRACEHNLNNRCWRIELLK